jgi:hypothetical protein
MKRRKALQAIVFYSIASNAIISCKNKEEVLNNIKLSKIKIDKHNADVIDEISKLIFPTDGIKEFSNHIALPFILKIVDDCYGDDDQKIFIQGVSRLNERAKLELKKDYHKLSIEEKKNLLKKINDESTETKSELKKFYDIIKDKTLQYYTTTEHYMRNHNAYEMAPGRFIGCKKITDLQTKLL